MSMAEQSEEWFKYNYQRENSVVSDIFEGQLMSKIEC